MRLVPDKSCKNESGKTMKSYWCKDATIFKFDTAEEALVAIGRGMRNRQMASTNKNHESSRSHAIFQLWLKAPTGGEHQNSPPQKPIKCSIVDLAGSERQKSSGTKGTSLREASGINKSLSALGNVIKALTSVDSAISAPYRNSKLTFLLRDSLGGANSRTALIATVSPGLDYLRESISTLLFARRCKFIRNKIVAPAKPELTVVPIEQYRLLQEQLRLQRRRFAQIATSFFNAGLR